MKADLYIVAVLLSMISLGMFLGGSLLIMLGLTEGSGTAATITVVCFCISLGVLVVAGNLLDSIGKEVKP